MVNEVYSRFGWRYWILTNSNASDIYLIRGRTRPNGKKKKLKEGSEEWKLLPLFWKQYCLNHWEKFPVNYEP